MLFCKKEDCKYRSKRKSTKYITKGREPVYKCKARFVAIVPYADGNLDQYITTENACMCLNYEKVGE